MKGFFWLKTEQFYHCYQPQIAHEEYINHMSTNNIKAIRRLWSRASIYNQCSLIRRFAENNNQKNVQQDVWMQFLAEEFAMTDPPYGIYK